MVIVIATASCAHCKARAVSKVNSSDGSNGGKYCGLYCSHWDGYTREWTSIGWFFGSNAKIEIEYHVTCNRCGNSQKCTHKYWGWPNGDSCTTNFKCCGKRLEFHTGFCTCPFLLFFYFILNYFNLCNFSFIFNSFLFSFSQICNTMQIKSNQIKPKKKISLQSIRYHFFCSQCNCFAMQLFCNAIFRLQCFRGIITKYAIVFF